MSSTENDTMNSNQMTPESMSLQSLSKREQAFGSDVLAISKGVELPFKISRLPAKKTFLYAYYIDWDYGTRFHIDLYLAPPNQKRHWWSLWSQTFERNTSEGMQLLYRGVPVVYIKAERGDSDSLIAKYMSTQLIKAHGTATGDISEGFLSKVDHYAIVLSVLEKRKADGLDPDFVKNKSLKIIDSALPDMQKIVMERINHDFEGCQLERQTTFTELAQREQAYSDWPITRVELPFTLQRLPAKRTYACTVGYESVGFWVDVRFELAQPVKGRPWWSLWAFVHGASFDGPKHNYPGCPLAYIRAQPNDNEDTITAFLLLQTTDSCCIGFHEVSEGLLNQHQLRAVQFCGQDSINKTGDFMDPHLVPADRDPILRHTFPDLRDRVAERLDEYFSS